MAYLGNTPTTQSFISGTDYFNGTGSQTAFTLSRTVNSVNDIEVFVNNVAQRPNDAYTISGTTLTFTGAPSAGTQNIYVRYLSTTTQTITPSQNTVSYASWNSDLQTETWAFRNRIINGAMVISQRNGTSSVTPGTNDYTLDRWKVFLTQTSKFTVQQNAGSVTPPPGFTSYLGITSTSAYSVISSDYFDITQPIEGFNVADLGWGTANSQPITISFWVRSSLTGTFGGGVTNSPYNRSYPFPYTINTANTWEYKTVTIPGDTTGTWLTDNSRGIELSFGLGNGSANSGTANTWQNGWAPAPTGAVSLVGTNGATLYITGVQLEKGSTATNFDVRPYGTELALCQRYCLKYCGNSALEDVNTATIIGFNGTSAYGAILTVVPMRASPSISSSTMRLTDETNTIAVTSIVASGASYSGPYNINCAFNAASGITQYRPYSLRAANSTSANVILSAEL